MGSRGEGRQQSISKTWQSSCNLIQWVMQNYKFLFKNDSVTQYTCEIGDTVSEVAGVAKDGDRPGKLGVRNR